jgi:hypothetical protein
MNAMLAPAHRGTQSHARPSARHAPRYELRFAALLKPGRGYAFPCDANGNVDIDDLPERARANYFYARTTIGREFYIPVTRSIIDAGHE